MRGQKKFLNERNYSVSMGMINREKLVQEIRKSCRPAGRVSDQDDDRPGLSTLGLVTFWTQSFFVVGLSCAL